MHLNELNHRSPLRILERSVHGGLGTGNLGIVAARAGVGKTGFLICVALDALLRDLRVIHVTTNQTVGHVQVNPVQGRERVGQEPPFDKATTYRLISILVQRHGGRRHAQYFDQTPRAIVSQDLKVLLCGNCDRL